MRPPDSFSIGSIPDFMGWKPTIRSMGIPAHAPCGQFKRRFHPGLHALEAHATAVSKVRKGNNGNERLRWSLPLRLRTPPGEVAEDAPIRGPHERAGNSRRSQPQERPAPPTPLPPQTQIHTATAPGLEL